MFKIIAGSIVLASVALATPALAQVRIEGPGVSVGVGERHHDRHNRRVVVRERDSYAKARCSTTRIERSDGSVKTVKKCN